MVEGWCGGSPVMRVGAYGCSWVEILQNARGPWAEAPASPEAHVNGKGGGAAGELLAAPSVFPFSPPRFQEGAAAPPDEKVRELHGKSIPVPRLNAPTPLLPPSSPCIPPPHFLLRPNSPGSAQEQPCSRSTGMRLNFCAMATSSREGDDCGRRAGTVPGVFPPSSLFGQARRC